MGFTDLSYHRIFLCSYFRSRPGVTDEDEPADPRFGYGYGSWPDQQTLSEASYSLFATAELARKHFVRTSLRVVVLLHIFSFYSYEIVDS